MFGITRIEKVEDCGNGYGWSIIKEEWRQTEGKPELFEIAVMQGDKLCHHPDVMPEGPILGYWDCINEVIDQIRELEAVK